MTITTSLRTWDVLKEFGFEPDASVWSDIQPGLSLDFGNFKLSASAVMNLRFKEVVMFGGTLTTSRTIALVEFEMPRLIQSREKCAAWLSWNLDKAADGAFKPLVPVEWLEMGRTNLRLLPWYFDKQAYEARPHCRADKALARPLLKALAKMAERMPPDEKVWFSFDGEVLKIRAGKELLAIAALGSAWTNQFGLNASQLTEPPRRIPAAGVWFAIWEDCFSIANCSYRGVAIKPTENP